MSKWLLTADYHIADYSDYNYTEGSRLKQYLTLANRIVELAKLNDCESLVIAGDLVDAPTMSPVVLHVVQEVIDIFKRNFKKVYYILGQHDLATKSKDQDKKYTSVSLFEDETGVLTYMHQKQIKVGNSLIGFQNWTKDQDTSWIDGHLDFLIGHYTKSSMFGQEIDESKFDYMIHGDIHNDQEIDKFISIGNPIQKDMSSLGNGSAIVLDLDNKSFKRIRIDEDHTRFLRMNYVSDQAKEGFESPLQYNIYKPIIKTEKITNRKLEWIEINDLIDKCVKDADLLDIHDICKTTCVPYKDIEFDFQLKYVKIHGYRSVIDFYMNFDTNERVLFLGENGTGKSSIMNGIYDIFNTNRFLKNNQSDFTDDMLLEAGIFYQNKLYIIKRGTEWGMSIDGIQLQYNKKSDFESDVIEKLPFLEYTDLFFIKSGVSNLSSQFTPDRRIELISKFFKLTKIEALSETAIHESERVQDEINKIEDSQKSEFGVNTYLTNQYNDYKAEAESLNESEIIEELTKIDESRHRHQIYTDWMNEIDKLRFRDKTLKDSLESKKKYLDIDVKSLTEKSLELDKRLNEINSQVEKNQSDWNEWTSLKTDLLNIEIQGKTIKSKIDIVKSGVCPECNQPLPDIPKKLDEINKVLSDMRSDYINKRSRYNELSHVSEGEVDVEYYRSKNRELTDLYNSISQAKIDINSRLGLYKSAKEESDEISKILKSNEDKLNQELGRDIKDSDKLYTDQDELVLRSDLNIIQKFNDIKDQLNKSNEKLNDLKSQIIPLKEKLLRFQKYAQLMSRTGKVFEEILRKLSDTFTSGDIKYDVTSGISRNKPWIQFNSYYKVKKKYRIYESLSDGQKNVSDLDFLSKLFSMKVGLLVLDEYVKHLDESNSLKASEILGKMNVGTLLISTHSSNYPIFTKKVFLKLDKDGHTINEII